MGARGEGAEGERGLPPPSPEEPDSFFSARRLALLRSRPPTQEGACSRSRPRPRPRRLLLQERGREGHVRRRGRRGASPQNRIILLGALTCYYDHPLIVTGWHLPSPVERKLLDADRVGEAKETFRSIKIPS